MNFEEALADINGEPYRPPVAQRADAFLRTLNLLVE